MRSVVVLAAAAGLLSGCGPVGGESNVNDNADANTNDNSARPRPAIQIGFGDPFEVVGDGGEFYASRGFQGLMDAFPTVRLLNFPPSATVRLTFRITLVNFDRLIMDDTLELTFVEIAPGVNELGAGLTLDESPSVAFGQPATLALTASAVTGEPTSASTELSVVITEAK